MVEDVGELLTKAGLEEFLDNFKQQVMRSLTIEYVLEKAITSPRGR